VKQVHLIVLYLIIYFKKFQSITFFIKLIDSLLTPVYCFYIYFPTTTKNGVYPTVKYGRRNQIMDIEISHICPRSSCFDTVEFHIRGSWLRIPTNFFGEFYFRHINCSEWTFLHRKLSIIWLSPMSVTYV